MKKVGNQELWLSLLAMILIGCVYALVVWKTAAIPDAASLFGHGLGIAGFLLMLMTEILYSLRKRSKLARWGRMSKWLQFHIFTGLVGPFMVLLHTSWKFNGLAGVITLLTVIIVGSGFLGRYIYTQIPRTLDGVELESAETDPRSAGVVRRARRLFSVWHAVHIPIGMVLFTAAFFHISAAIYYATLLH